jgi:hypothetical protein
VRRCYKLLRVGVRTANSAPLFTQEEILKAQRDGVRKYFINYKMASGDPDDKQTQKKYVGEW